MSSHQGGQDWRANLGVKPSINPKPCIQLFANEAAAAYNFIYVRINLKVLFLLVLRMLKGNERLRPVRKECRDGVSNGCLLPESTTTA